MPGNGPAPTSKAELKARGSPRAKDRATDLAGKLPNNAPACPRHLAGDARKEWKRVVPALAKTGILTPADRGHLIGLCEAWQAYVDYGNLEAVSLFGEALPGSQEWRRIVSSRMEALKMYLDIARKFGLNPEDRSRVKIPKTVPQGGTGKLLKYCRNED